MFVVRKQYETYSSRHHSCFVAGLGLGYFVRSLGIGKPQGTDMHAPDWAAIEKLHKADVEATIKQDPSALTTLWSDDGANFGFPGPPVVGTKAMAEAHAKMRAEYPEFKVLNYTPAIRRCRSPMGGRLRPAVLKPYTKCQRRTNRSM
jgi:hypothetical protein